MPFRSLAQNQTTDLSPTSHERFAATSAWQQAYARLLGVPTATPPAVSFPAEDVFVLHLLRAPPHLDESSAC